MWGKLAVNMAGGLYLLATVMFLSSGINFSLSEYCSFGPSVSLPALDEVTQTPSLAQMRKHLASVHY